MGEPVEMSEQRAPGAAAPGPADVDFRALFEAAPICCLVLDRELRVITATAGWLAHTGSRPEDLRGRPWSDLLALGEGDADRLLASLERVLRERVEDAVPPEAGPSGPGAGRVLRRVNRPVLGGDGAVAAILHCLEGADAVPAVAAPSSGPDCERLLGATQDALWDWDVPSRRVYYSPRWKALRGYAQGDLDDAEDHWRSGIHPEDAPRVLAALEEHFAGRRETFSEEYRVRCADGTWKWILDRGTALRDAAGRVVRMVGSEHDITDRRRAEQALRESEERFRAMADGIPLGIWVHDAQARQQFVNRTYCDFVGIRLEDVHDDAWRRLLHPEDLHGFTEAFLAAVRERRPFHREARVRRADGEWRWCEFWAQPHFGSDGAYLGVIGASADVNARKHAEEALIRSEARYRDLVHEANSAILRWRCDGTITFFNEYAELLFGWRAEEIIGRNASLLIPERDAAGTDLRGLVRAIAEHPERYHSNINENLCRDGRRLWVFWTTKPVLDERGELVEILAVGSDITELKRANEALRRSEATFRRIAEANLVGVGIGDWRGRITYLNDEMLRMMGRPRADLEAGLVNWAEALAPECRGEVPEMSERLRREGRLDRYERAFLRPDGERTWFLGAAALLDAEGEEHMSIALDITPRKRDEEALREADRRKDEFLATLGHELRNPLAPLRACLDVIAHGEPDAATLADVHRMMDRQVTQMMRLVEDLLEVSRITRGVIELRKEPVDLAEVLRAALDTSRPLIEAAGCRVTLDLPDGPLPLEADPVRLVQVVTNLLNNAAKYSPGRGDRPHGHHGRGLAAPQCAGPRGRHRPGAAAAGVRDVHPGRAHAPGRPRHRAHPGAQPGPAPRR